MEIYYFFISIQQMCSFKSFSNKSFTLKRAPRFKFEWLWNTWIYFKLIWFLLILVNISTEQKGKNLLGWIFHFSFLLLTTKGTQPILYYNSFQSPQFKVYRNAIAHTIKFWIWLRRHNMRHKNIKFVKNERIGLLSNKL